jgi:transposase
VINQPRGKEIHVIADNLSAHKSATVKDFLAVHPKVQLHFTRTYSSWLNQVELWANGGPAIPRGWAGRRW